MVKKDGMILEHPSLRVRKDGLVFEKTPSLMGKSDANECNESSLSNCRVQLALSTKKYGYVFEKNFFLKRAREFRKQPSFPFKNS